MSKNGYLFKKQKNKDEFLQLFFLFCIFHQFHTSYIQKKFIGNSNCIFVPFRYAYMYLTMQMVLICESSAKKTIKERKAHHVQCIFVC